MLMQTCPCKVEGAVSDGSFARVEFLLKPEDKWLGHVSGETHRRFSALTVEALQA